ncbi:hypothetical protein G7Y89_g7893 [Cudoniella acicularis]|uniref:Solute carrier family 40 member n=1 Tax=Cudoniella acicularis TaxID=354080 RepID=A0A8H4RL71_9HELO|nr:hypothetical protein G7Y89_g7893 [Cudoniella acicularis]
MASNDEAERGITVTPEEGENLNVLEFSPDATPLAIDDQDGMTQSQALNLYTRGIVRTLASICFASTVGRWVDKAPHRLKTLSSTITVNRVAVICASILWFFIVEPGKSDNGAHLESGFRGPPITNVVKDGMFALILFLGILETLSASGNMLSMERDFIVTASDPDGGPYDLTHLNSIMRRIDLICKLIAPILISAIISVTGIKIGVLVVGSMSSASWGVELFCAKRVWDANPRLRVLKTVAESLPSTPVLLSQNPFAKIFRALRQYGQDFKNYFSSPVWIPSLALSFLHLSALAYNATFITFLLNVGFSLGLITIARAAGSVVEISSTLVTPVGVQYLSKAKDHGRFRGETRASMESADSRQGLLGEIPEVQAGVETGLERLGLWGISWQLLNLVSTLELSTDSL